MTRSTGIRVCTLLFLSLTAGSAYAHGGGTTGTATVAIDGQQVRYSLSLSDIPPGPLADQMKFGQPGIAPDYQALPTAIARHIRIASAGGAACDAGAQTLRPPSAAAISIEASVTFTCPGDVGRLFIRDDLTDALGPDHHTFTLLLWPGGSGQYTFDASARELFWSANHGIQPVIGTGGAFRVGVAHVFQGYAHLLFLLALMLGAGMRAWPAIISTFALAHGLAMVLPAFEIAALSPRLGDAAMLLAIAGIAAQNLFPRYSLAPGWVVATVIGALHGLGSTPASQAFAFSLDGRWSGLLAHTAGLWVGQALVVAMTLPVLRLWRDKAWAPKISAILSACLLAASGYLLLRWTLSGL